MWAEVAEDSLLTDAAVISAWLIVLWLYKRKDDLSGFSVSTLEVELSWLDDPPDIGNCRRDESWGGVEARDDRALPCGTSYVLESSIVLALCTTVYTCGVGVRGRVLGELAVATPLSSFGDGTRCGDPTGDFLALSDGLFFEPMISSEEPSPVYELLL